MHVILLLKRRVSPRPQGLSHSTQFNHAAHLKLVHPIDGATNPTIPLWYLVSRTLFVMLN